MLVKEIVGNFNIALNKIGKPSVPELEKEAIQLCQKVQAGELTPDDLPSEHVVIRLIDYYATERIKQTLKGVVVSPDRSHEETCFAYKSLYGIDNVDISGEGLDKIIHFLGTIDGITVNEVIKLESAK